jgi:hypothetical protein
VRKSGYADGRRETAGIPFQGPKEVAEVDSIVKLKAILSDAFKSAHIKSATFEGQGGA